MSMPKSEIEKRLPISVIIITYNEASNIARTLASLSFAEEIIVVDSGSEDNTVNIARRYTSKVYVHDWPGYGPQKNRALDYATCPWVLSVDADEVVSDALVDVLAQAIQRENIAGYYIPIRLMFYGRLIRHTVGRSQHIRLFRREVTRFDDKAIHENCMVDGKVASLDKPLYHYSYRSVEHMLDKMNLYSSLSARMKAGLGKRASVTKAALHGLWMFLKMYIFNRGFLDGSAGFVISVAFAEGSYYRYVKLAYDKTDEACNSPSFD